jgi:hypothetical protein
MYSQIPEPQPAGWARTLVREGWRPVSDHSPPGERQCRAPGAIHSSPESGSPPVSARSGSGFLDLSRNQARKRACPVVPGQSPGRGLPASITGHPSATAFQAPAEPLKDCAWAGRAWGGHTAGGRRSEGESRPDACAFVITRPSAPGSACAPSRPATPRRWLSSSAGAHPGRGQRAPTYP